MHKVSLPDMLQTQFMQSKVNRIKSGSANASNSPNPKSKETRCIMYQKSCYITWSANPNAPKAYQSTNISTSRFVLTSIISAVLQIVAGHQTRPAVLPDYLSLPPAVVLQTEHGENVALREAEFLRNLGLIHVHCAGCG